VGTLTGKYKHSKLKTVYANKTELMFTAQWNFAKIFGIRKLES